MPRISRNPCQRDRGDFRDMLYPYVQLQSQYLRGLLGDRVSLGATKSAACFILRTDSAWSLPWSSVTCLAQWSHLT